MPPEIAVDKNLENRLPDDKLVLRVLLEDGLSDFERGAFVDMLVSLKKWGALTERQRAWAQRVAHREGLPVAPVDPVPASAWDPSPKRRRRSG